MKVNKKEINSNTQDVERSNASKLLYTSQLHSPEIHSPGSSLTPRSSHLFNQDLEEEPVFSQFTGFSAPIWSFDDALKLIQDRSGTGKRDPTIGKIISSLSESENYIKENN